jgi:hypothetical protein
VRGGGAVGEECMESAGTMMEGEGEGEGEGAG